MSKAAAAEVKRRKMSYMTGTAWIRPRWIKSVTTYGALGRNISQSIKPIMKNGFMILFLSVFKIKMELIKNGTKAKSIFHRI
ncbi:MAG: hypothetical protein WCW04_03140 [Candidatus Paceibacterota bacterium]